MAYRRYLQEVLQLIQTIESQNGESIEAGARKMASCIQQGGFCHFFGSGHSIIPVLDAFPRYGGFLGLNPLMDARLMWFSAIGSANAPGLLNIERREGYVEDGFLRYQPVFRGDVLVVYSHGGLNAAPVEAALYGNKVGAYVIAITSMAHQSEARSTHSSGKKLSDIADLCIDNCVPPEDAVVSLPGKRQKVGATSSIAAIAVTMSLTAQTAEYLNEMEEDLEIFVSPNVPGFGVDYNLGVFDLHNRRMARHMAKNQEE